MYFYELDYHFEDEERHILLKHSQKYSKHEFWKMCNKYFHMFPKKRRVSRMHGKEYVYYTWNEFECLEFISNKLCEVYGFTIVDLQSKYFLASKLTDVDYLC